MRYFITGIDGQLGYDIKKELESLGENDIVAPTYPSFDICDRDHVLTYIKEVKPDVIFHCAAYTAVDLAEEEKDICYQVNVEGTRNMVDAAKATNALIIFISSDYVFDGTKEGVYKEDDLQNALSVYGKSKVEGEAIVSSYEKHFIARLSWVFGIHGKNFVKTMLRLGKEKESLSVVNDQIGSPTYTVDAAKVLVEMSKSKDYGLYHVTNEGFCSWYQFAIDIFKEANLPTKVVPIATEEYPQKATRPKNSKLSKEKMKQHGFSEMPSYQDALKRYIKELTDTC